MSERKQVTPETVSAVLDLMRANLIHRINQKGYGVFSSNHEALGAITEEYYEVIEAIREGNETKVAGEMMDLAVAALFEVASIRTRT